MNMRHERLDNTIVLHPEVGSHSATIVILHGLGDSCDGWEDAAGHLSRTLSYCKFILPTAPQIPVTLNGGQKMPAWLEFFFRVFF
jgi:hypothetical protein